MRRNVLGAVLFVLFAFSVSAGPSAAGPPKRHNLDVRFSSVNTAICGFPIQLTGRATGFYIEFYNRSGQLRRAEYHLTEFLSLSAGDKSIIADPIKVNFHTTYRSDGTIARDYLTGLVAKFTLPDGTKFLSAGRFDFAAAGVSFTLTPDVGRSGDVSAFCAALS